MHPAILSIAGLAGLLFVSGGLLVLLRVTKEENKEGAVIITLPYNQTVQEGKVTELPCVVRGVRGSNVKWKREGVEVHQLEGLATRAVKRKDGILIINATSVDDEGFYTCEVSNGIGTRQSATTYLDVVCGCLNCDGWVLGTCIRISKDGGDQSACCGGSLVTPLDQRRARACSIDTTHDSGIVIGEESFKILSGAVSWDAAQKMCEDDGLIIAEPKNPPAVATYLEEHYAGSSYGGLWWWGARGKDGTNSFQWISSGQPLYGPNRYWEPYARPGDLCDARYDEACCLAARGSFLPNQPFQARDCSETNRVMCQCPEARP